jgi:hypothetical protein
MLRFYPRSTRTAFGEEMRGVFLEKCHAEADNSPWGCVRVLFRELIDFPKALLSAYHDALAPQWRQASHAGPLRFAGKDVVARKVGMVASEMENMIKQRAVISALPPAILGFGVMLGALTRTDVWYRLPPWQLYLSAGVVLMSGIVVGTGGLIALLRRIPDWGLTWVGCAFMGITLSTQVIVSEGVDEGWFSISPAAELGLGLAFFATGCALLLWIAARGWSRAGLFTIAAAATMGLSLFQSVTAAPFNRDDIALLAGPLGLLFSMVIYAYIFQSGKIRIAIIVGIGVVNVGVVFISASAWLSWLENRGAVSPLLPLLVIITGLLLSGPISALILDPIKRLRDWNRPAV